MPRRPVPVAETKAQKFERLANLRTNLILEDPSVQMVMPYSPLAQMFQLDEPCQKHTARSAQDRVPLDGANATARESGHG
jgi:hypothetical protein